MERGQDREATGAVQNQTPPPSHSALGLPSAVTSRGQREVVCKGTLCSYGRGPVGNSCHLALLRIPGGRIQTTRAISKCGRAVHTAGHGETGYQTWRRLVPRLWITGGAGAGESWPLTNSSAYLQESCHLGCRESSESKITGSGVSLPG